MSGYMMMLYVVVVLILCSQHCTTSYHLLPVSSRLLTQKHFYTASLHQTTHSDVRKSLTALWDAVESVEEEKKIDPAASNWNREVLVTSNSVFGNILVTGLGHMEEDEFILTMLNNQNVWQEIVLGTTEVASTKRRLLSRSARYSGLLNLLDVTELTLPRVTDDEVSLQTRQNQLKNILQNKQAWLAYNISTDQIETLAKIALEANVPRVIFTTTISDEEITTNPQPLSAFQNAISLFEEKGLKFTGIRHGKILSGPDDVPYRIVNATKTCREPEITRGVLGRVASELLLIDASFSGECTVSSIGTTPVDVLALETGKFQKYYDTPDVESMGFISAYLNVLRSTGFTRQEEVYKLYTGGLSRIQGTMEEEYKRRYAAKLRYEKEKQAAEARRLKEDEEYKRMLRNGVAVRLGSRSMAELGPTEEELIEERTKLILDRVYKYYYSNMMALSTSSTYFNIENYEKAKALAKKEIEEEKEERHREQQQRLAQMQIKEVEEGTKKREQYRKLLSLNEQEQNHQIAVSLKWMKYLYVLLERTNMCCQENDILFFNLDLFEKVVILRTAANDMRNFCNLPPGHMIYEESDVDYILQGYNADESYFTKEDGSLMDGEEVANMLMEEYGKYVQEIKELGGMDAIVNAAITFLKGKVPDRPLDVSEMRAKETAGLTAYYEKLRQKQEASRSRKVMAERSQDTSNANAVGVM